MKKLEENVNGKTLMESCIHAKMSPLPLTEEVKGDMAGAWKCPLWNLGVLNLNGRVYPAELGERLVRENRVTPVCDGHDPDARFEYKNYVAVAKEPWIEGNYFGCNVYVIDEKYQEKLEKLNKLGLPIGVSSVGYGECDMDGVVNPATYELVRYLDFVTYPAGEVYAEPKKESLNKSEKSADDQTDESADLSRAKVEAFRIYHNLLSMEESK